MKLAVAALAVAACGGGAHYPAPWGEKAPTFDDELAILERARGAVTSFHAVATVNGTSELEVSATDRYLRVRTPRAELVQDMGVIDGFTMIDRTRGCVCHGSCESDDSMRTLGVNVALVDLQDFAAGTAPIIHCGPIVGDVTWDPHTGREHVDYGFTEDNGERCTVEGSIEIDRRDGRRDVVAIADKNGQMTLARVEYEGFHEISDAKGQRFRVPARTRHVTGVGAPDLVIDWRRVELNPALGPDAFRLDVPAGMPACP